MRRLELWHKVQEIWDCLSCLSDLTQPCQACLYVRPKKAGYSAKALSSSFLIGWARENWTWTCHDERSLQFCGIAFCGHCQVPHERNPPSGSKAVLLPVYRAMLGDPEFPVNSLGTCTVRDREGNSSTLTMTTDKVTLQCKPGSSTQGQPTACRFYSLSEIIYKMMKIIYIIKMTFCPKQPGGGHLSKHICLVATRNYVSHVLKVLTACSEHAWKQEDLVLDCIARGWVCCSHRVQCMRPQEKPVSLTASTSN